MAIKNLLLRSAKALIPVILLTPVLVGEGLQRRYYEEQRNGIILRVSIPNGEICWKDFEVQLEIKNGTGLPLKILYVNELNGFWFSVKDETGSNMPLTEEGNTFFGGGPGPLMAVSQEIGKGGHIVDKFKLCKYFILRKVGNYKVSVFWATVNQPMVEGIGIPDIEIRDIPFTISRLK